MRSLRVHHVNKDVFPNSVAEMWAREECLRVYQTYCIYVLCTYNMYPYLFCVYIVRFFSWKFTGIEDPTRGHESSDEVCQWETRVGLKAMMLSNTNAAKVTIRPQIVSHFMSLPWVRNTNARCKDIIYLT